MPGRSEAPAGDPGSKLPRSQPAVAPMNATLRSMADLVQALRDARDDRGVTHESLDAISGLPPGYVSKLLAPNPIRHVGYQSLGDLMGALGKALVMVDDPQQIERVEKRWVKRKREVKPAALSIALSIAGETQENPSNQRKQRMQELGRKGGKRRMQTMSKRARQRIATHAARMRWAKSKKATP